ncbi:hypothetical protein NQ315_012617 [Exocentrus adspersus]|uniref:Thioredoxin domain-containing protein n=1 Tax=Exocentrus adspersus TaxID=1586481 RepID=A0AAV8VSX6_9CUCU|nr:hypothetical protein NQ315_012617 [Exocentrus adspersus]
MHISLYLCTFATIFLIPTVFAHEDDVHTLKYNADNFSEEVGKKNHFVMFYAPWQVQRLAPTWEQLAEMLNEEDSNIKIAKVDCTTESKVCADEDVTGYPTLKFFKVGYAEGVKFRGTRDLPSLTNFINEQLREVRNRQRRSEAQVDRYQGDRSHDDLKQYVGKMLGTDKEKQGDGEQGDEVSATGSELTGDNFKEGIETGTTFVKFFAPWCGHCKRLSPTWDSLREKFSTKPGVSIVKVDCTIDANKQLCNDEEVEGFPSMFLYKNGVKVSEYSGSRSLDDLYDFVVKHLGHDEL